MRCALNKISSKMTYINPTPLPAMPVGRLSGTDGGAWREVADPSVLYDGGKWYLYPSCGMAWVSEDFCTWKHVRVEPYDCGYAPTVVKHRGKYLLASCLSELYVSSSPLGKFEKIGVFTLKDSSPLGAFYDPMLFSDDDGRLYIYYCVYVPEEHSTAIFAAELDGDEPTRFITDPVKLISFDPSHVWERNGENNEDSATSAVEGPWMFKKNGIYYLIYSAPGTEYSSYALGAYKSTSPLSGFEYMKTSPFTSKRTGVVRGPGHGCVVEGPNGTLWVFYTCILCAKHKFERMIGYDEIEIDGSGDLVCRNITDKPRFAPGSGEGDTGLVSLCAGREASASSEAAGRCARYALTEELYTWWQAAPSDSLPTLEIPLPPLGAEVSAVRIIWNEAGLDPENNVNGGSFGYILEFTDENGIPVRAADSAGSAEALPVEYRTFAPVRAKSARLVITHTPDGITPAIYNISLFGKA